MKQEKETGTVLIVDDEEPLRTALAAHLRHAGFATLACGNGIEGVSLARQEQPDVILMDVNMPLMDGLEATRLLRREPETREIPIIILTARSGTDNLVKGLEAGAHDYIFKPFDMAELVARVKTMSRVAFMQREMEHLNVRLEREVEEKTVRLKLLYEFVEALGRAESREEILDLVVDCVRRTTGARRISMLMTDGSGEKLVCERAIGIDPAIVGSIKIDTTQGIAGHIYRTGTTVVAQSMAAHASELRYEANSFVCTPLLSTTKLSRDGILGVLNVTDKPDDLPFSQEEVDCIRSIADAATIALHNVMRRSQLESSVGVLLETLGHLAEYRDEETTAHLKRVARMSRVLTEQLSRASGFEKLIDREFIENIVKAAPMHDIGKVGIPDEILTKPGTLTAEEFQIMKAHTEIGRRVLSGALDPSNPVPLLQMCVDIAYCHHERFNGTGYPRRLKGEAIPLPARIIALVDAYDAITSNRRYSSARPHATAVKIIEGESGAHFDPAIVDAFLLCHEQFDAIRTESGETPDCGAMAYAGSEAVLAGRVHESS